MMYPKFRLSTVLIILMLVIVACNQTQQQVADLPTLAVLPSLTPSHTPTETPPATATNTPTATFTTTNTPLPTLTDTLTPSLTFTPSPTPTATNTPTNTPTDTPVATNTPTATPTPNAPQIISFTASMNAVAPGASIILRWQSIADTAQIDLQNQQGVVLQTFSVTPSGELPVTIPPNVKGLVIYRLTAMRGGLTANFSVPITVTCAIDWFFGNEFAPDFANCPVAVGAIGAGAFQPFENGFMIYVDANNLNKIYVLLAQDNRYAAFINDWDGSGNPFPDPPSGLVKPRRMFRWLYLFGPKPFGEWLDVTGWATEREDESNRTIQFEQNTGAFYIDSPIGVFRFSGGDSGTWTQIK